MSTRSCIVPHLKTPADPFTLRLPNKATQGLLSPRQSLNVITDYFSQLYQYQTQQRPPHQRFYLQTPLNIGESEIEEAINSLSQRKALPKGHAPAALWKVCRAEIAPVLFKDFQTRFQPGPLELPKTWNMAFVTLSPKPQKPPNCPANLRPSIQAPS